MWRIWFHKKKWTIRRRPSSVFIDSSVFAHVGLTEAEAIERGFKVKVAKLPAAASPRARQLKQTEGLLKWPRR
ncbi:hypothetical protein [Paenibacillus sanfengchensis]|uniref:hypothetical protein n=1 Tax=Paenibacillus sanfengchensis TaxID=3119819 RepID=UPI003A5C007A